MLLKQEGYDYENFTLFNASIVDPCYIYLSCSENLKKKMDCCEMNNI